MMASLVIIHVIGEEPTTIANGFKFTEGPAVSADGTIYFTDQPNDRIVRIATDGSVDTWMQPSGRSNGLFFAPDGKLIACADADNELWEIDVIDKSHRVLVKDPGGRRLDGPNDVWVHPNTGTIYFTDPHYRRPWWKHDSPVREDRSLYQCDRDGGNVRRVEFDFVQPNGIIGDVQRNRLYVADIDAKVTYVFDMNDEGELSGGRKFVDQGSDGMAVDRLGNVYLTGKGVDAYDPDGNAIGHIDIPAGWTANITVTRDAPQRLIITASDRVFAHPVISVDRQIRGSNPKSK